MRTNLGATDVAREMTVINSGVFRQLRPVAVEALELLQSARTVEQFAALEHLLLKQFLRHQVVQERLRDEIEDRKAERGRLVAQEPRPVTRIGAMNESIRADEDADHALACALHALRCVGDGIAWKAVGYDRRAVSVMGDGRRVGRLADEQGLQAELAEMRRLLVEEGRFAIHNDATNCLRHGDLTIPTRLTGPRDVEIAEIKAGGRGKRRQIMRLDERLELLRTGAAGPSERTPGGLRILPGVVPLEVFHVHLAAAVRDARRDGIGYASPLPCLAIDVVDMRRLDDGREPGPEEDWTTAGVRRRGLDVDDPRVVRTLSFERRLRERRDSWAFIAPITILPLPAVDVADLLLGGLDVCTTLFCDELEAVFARAGLHCEVAGTDQQAERFLRVSDGLSTVSMPPAIREHMLAELVSPISIVHAAQLSLAAVAVDDAAQPAGHLVTYHDEQRVWDLPPLVAAGTGS